VADVLYLPRRASQAPDVPTPDAPPEVWSSFWQALAEWAPVYRATWGRPA
jgi:hypothetical protein